VELAELRLYQRRTATAHWIWMSPVKVGRRGRPPADLKTSDTWREEDLNLESDSELMWNEPYAG
jgi:hypothetical protein